MAIAFPYEQEGSALRVRSPEELADLLRVLWPVKEVLRSRLMFGKTQEVAGLAWYEFRHIAPDRICASRLIAFAFVATHNHFVLDLGGKVFNRTAPVIKLPADASEEAHLELLGLLNSSTACFWMKQVSHNKGSTVDEHGARQRTTPFEDFWEFESAKLQRFPVPAATAGNLACALTEAGRGLEEARPQSIARGEVPSRRSMAAARNGSVSLLARLVAVQEDLDWTCYHLYGLLDATLALPSDRTPGIRLGERAFEIVMARKIAAGELETRWFERHGSTPVTEIPARWPDEYREIVRRRIEVIATNADIALIEQPEYKRRWNTEPCDAREMRALRNWLVDRLENARYWPESKVISCAHLADGLRHDAEFLQVAELYRGRSDFDLTELVAELVEDESVPFLAAFRISESGLRKRAAWERTWALQRREDAGEKVTIEVPPKYKQDDFRDGTYWRLRGKLDVPKERFIVYPLAGRDSDPTPVIGWAGWDHLQQAKALAAWIVERQTQDGWGRDRLMPLLAGLLELVPWLKQWHNDIDPETGQRLGDYFAQWVEGKAREIGATLDDLRSWTPPAGAGRRPRKKKEGDA